MTFAYRQFAGPSICSPKTWHSAVVRTERHVTDRDLLQTILAVLPMQIVVTDGNGTIVYANAAWDDAARAAGVRNLGKVSVGANYLTVVARSAESGESEAADSLLGLQSVSSGASDYFEIEYPCSRPDKAYWYIMRVVPLAGEPPRGLVITHLDITYSRQDMASMFSDRQAAERQRRQNREMDSLEAISSQHSTSVAATIYGKVPVSEANPAVFGALVNRYGQALHHAVEQRTYRVQNSLDDDLREIAQRLRFQNAGPRDVMDIHVAAIKAELKRANGAGEAFLLEESRPLILRLMGNLLSLYRLEAIATRQSFASRESE